MDKELYSLIKSGIKYDIDPKFAYAVAMIESSGKAYSANSTSARKTPTFRFEKHVFAKYVKDVPTYLVGSNNDQYYFALLADSHAAMLSTSYGLFQIMGFNHKAVGYDTVEEFVEALEESPVNHVTSFCEFIKSNKLLNTIKLLDFTEFAKRYNGPMYYRTNYHTKLSEIYYSV